MDFNQECKRKGQLLDLFWELQETERREMHAAQKKTPHLKYDRMFRGLAFVEDIRTLSLKLMRENGKIIKCFEISPQIAELVRPEDHFFMTAGRRHGVWRLISMEGIGTEFEGEEGREPQIHISGMNPLRKSISPDLH